MKKTLIFLALTVCVFLSSCGDDAWDYDHSLEHVYYYGLCNEAYPGGNEKVYTVAQGGTVEVPTQFWSSFTRSYSPTVYYYTSPVPDTDDEDGVDEPQLVCGTDYVVVDANGNTLTPDANGAYPMTWPNAVAGIQNVYIKALNGQTGSIRVLTFDPTKTMNNMDVESTVIVRTNEYEVRAFTENYYVTVNIE